MGHYGKGVDPYTHSFANGNGAPTTKPGDWQLTLVRESAETFWRHL
jgi:hypothetical protein